MEKLLTKTELAEKMGISVDGLNKIVSRRGIPVIKISRKCVRFRITDVERALNKVTLKER